MYVREHQPWRHRWSGLHAESEVWTLSTPTSSSTFEFLPTGTMAMAGLHHSTPPAWLHLQLSASVHWLAATSAHSVPGLSELLLLLLLNMHVDLLVIGLVTSNPQSQSEPDSCAFCTPKSGAVGWLSVCSQSGSGTGSSFSRTRLTLNNVMQDHRETSKQHVEVKRPNMNCPQTSPGLLGPLPGLVRVTREAF